MADAPATPPPMGDLFASYQPQGGGPDALFAPAYIKGFAPAEQAVADWTKAHRTDPSIIDQTRMEPLWNAPDVTQTAPGTWTAMPSSGNWGGGAGGANYGEGRIPSNLSFLPSNGIADPAALKAVAQGTAYTGLDARRNAIAERLQYNEAARDAYQMRADARGEGGLTGGTIKPGGYGSGDLYTKYMQANNPSGWNDPLIINNNPGGGGYIRGPIDDWPANVSNQPTAADMSPVTADLLKQKQQAQLNQGSASNLNLIQPYGSIY